MAPAVLYRAGDLMRRSFLIASLLFVPISWAAADTVSFTYLGHDVTGIGGTSSGSGSFTFAGGLTTIGLGDLTSFAFSQTTNINIPGLPPSVTFSYILPDLVDFAASLTGGVLTSLSLHTIEVPGIPSGFNPESFNVTSLAVNGAFTATGDITLQVGTVTIGAATVPEPSSLILFATIGFALTVATFRRSRLIS
jgi:hypothetical protein